MPLTNAGAALMTPLLVGSGGPAYDNAHAYLGVGDSTVAFDPTQTDLQASSNKQRKPVDPTFPTVSGTQITMQATFGLTDALFSWNEWSVCNDPTAGTMLVRKVETLGSGAKPNTEIWILAVTLTLSAT